MINRGVLGKHEVLEVSEEPLAADAFDIGRRVHVDRHVGQVLVCLGASLHRFSVSPLS